VGREKTRRKDGERLSESAPFVSGPGKANSYSQKKPVTKQTTFTPMFFSRPVVFNNERILKKNAIPDDFKKRKRKYNTKIL
jgi:hypothetical protein